MVIKVCACGICGTDLHWSEINNEESGFRDIHPGAVMGHEFSGEIVEIGKNNPKNGAVIAIGKDLLIQCAVIFPKSGKKSKFGCKSYA